MALSLWDRNVVFVNDHQFNRNSNYFCTLTELKMAKNKPSLSP